MATFTSGELEVMQVLWDHGALNPTQIEERFPRPIQNAALRSVLLILLEKGHVSREKVGRSFVYRARTPRQNTFKNMVRRLSDVFCGGSPAALIAQIIKTEKLSKEDIAELRRVMSQAEEPVADTRKKGKRS